MPPPGLSGTIGSGQKRKATKSSHSRSYPRGVGLDFRKLGGLTLVSYIDHHGVQVRPEAPPSELAVAVARHFEALEVDEEACIGGFLERLSEGTTNPTEYSRETQHYNGYRLSVKRRRTRFAARPGEQVAAKVTRTDENGSWILASVQRFYIDTETYDVQDEDDTSKLIRLPWSHVMRLSTGTEGCFDKGKDVMAIFPETTSFYKAKVAKSPVWELERGIPCVKEVIVKFEDDEDQYGRTPHRRVPSRYVIPAPLDYFYDENEDVDLIAPTTTKP
mmetsp:Transcript_3484/g.7911  ORF Transcript_3484/g.7911 Transcript_3484/m.7911 type:complete len:275 (-) Transcript_3484:148-972(-)